MSRVAVAVAATAIATFPLASDTRLFENITDGSLLHNLINELPNIHVLKETLPLLLSDLRLQLSQRHRQREVINPSRIRVFVLPMHL